VHAATAILNDVDELHTFDGADLLAFDGILPMPNGKKLKICKPPKHPVPDQSDLFAEDERDADNKDDDSAEKDSAAG
jgi:hypothetical protein